MYSANAHDRNPSEEVHPVILVLDVVGDIDVRVVPLHHPKKRVGNELKVGYPEVFQRDQSGVTQSAHDLSKVYRARATETQGQESTHGRIIRDSSRANGFQVHILVIPSK